VFETAMKRIRSIAVLALAALTLPMAACSSSSSQSGSINGGSGGGHGAATKSAVEVGFVGTFSGPTVASGATTKPVVQAWAKYINDKGGLDGHPVDLIVKDAAGPTGTNLTAVKDLISQKVAVIFDEDQNDVEWIKLANQVGIPVISSTTSAQLLSNTDFTFFQSSSAQTYLFASAARLLGTKLAIGYAAEAPVAAQYAALIKTLGEKVGVSVVVSSKLSASQPDYTAFCQLVKGSGAQAILLSLTTDIAQKVADQCYQQGVRLPQVIFGGQTPRSWLSDPAFEGAVAQDGMAPFFDTALPGVAAYRDAMKTYLPSLLGSAQDSPGGLNGWAFGKMLEYAVTNGGGTTSAEIMKGLYTAKDLTLDGIIAPVTYVQGKGVRNDCGFVWTIKNQQYALTAQGSKPQCAPDALVASFDAATKKALEG
jgi:branched-chain amino acid transport system substrate-binding protein